MTAGARDAAWRTVGRLVRQNGAVIRVGLTGGIAAGKSVAERRLADWGVTVIDYDQLARDVVGPGSAGLADLVAVCGPAILRPDGGLDRPELARRTFADPECRHRVEAVIHPLVYAAAAADEARARRRGAAMVVHDIPLLVETADRAGFDHIIVVTAPADLRVERLMAERGLDRRQAEARIRAQSSEAERLAVADVVFDGSGTIDHLRHQVDRWLTDLGWPADHQVAPVDDAVQTPTE